MKSTFPYCSLAFAAGTAFGSLAVYYGILQRRKRTAEEHLWEIVRSSFTGALLYAGDKLNLYEMLAQSGGPISAAALAERTKWSERWLYEFLAHACAAKICRFHEHTQQFSLQRDYAALLRDPKQSSVSIAGMFQFLLPLLKRADSVVQAIRTGVGVDYDFGEDGVEAIDRKNSNWFRDHLVKDVLSRISIPLTKQSLITVLERGVNVADIGCGCGSSTVAMAKRFPKSHFYAYESSHRSLQILSSRLSAEGLTNITVCNVVKRSVGGGPDSGKFTFVYAHDVVHDMTHPKTMIQDVKKVLYEEGCWVIVDVKCHDKLSDNLRLPNAELLFGYSCLLCLNSATSTTDGAGLGTCGFPTSLARQWTTEEGFTHFTELSIPSMPMESCFVVA